MYEHSANVKNKAHMIINMANQAGIISENRQNVQNMNYFQL